MLVFTIRTIQAVYGDNGRLFLNANVDSHLSVETFRSLHMHLLTLSTLMPCQVNICQLFMVWRHFYKLFGCLTQFWDIQGHPYLATGGAFSFSESTFFNGSNDV